MFTCWSLYCVKAGEILLSIEQEFIEISLDCFTDPHTKERSDLTTRGCKYEREMNNDTTIKCYIKLQYLQMSVE